MKRLFILLAFVLAACLLLSACDTLHSLAAQSISNSVAASAPSPEPTATVTPLLISEGGIDYSDIDRVHVYFQEYYSGEIEKADKCRVKAGDTEYYLDTSKILEMDVCGEFPLYRLKDGDFTEYLGTTGFAFQVFGGYIYVQSDPYQEDGPDGTLTRVVNLNDLSVTPLGRNVDIFTPKEGSQVYYTSGGDGYIYIADASLMHPKKLYIEVPDRDTIEKKIKLSINDIFVYIGVTDVKDGWIYFDYYLFEPEGPSYYEGNYRIKADGSKIVKIGEGKFGDEID